MVRQYDKIIKYGGIITGLILSVIIFYAVFVVDELVLIPGTYTITDNNGTSFQTENVAEYTRWFEKKGEWFEVEFNMEKSTNYRDMLVFENEGAQVEVYIDDEFAYSNSKKLEEAVFKEGIEMIPVNIHNLDTKINIRFTASSVHFISKCPKFYLANEETVYTNYIQRNIIRFGIAIVFILLGTICILFGMFRDEFISQYKKIFTLALFCIINGFIMLIDNKMGIVFIRSYRNLFILKNVLNIIMCCIFTLYLRIKEERNKDVDRCLKVICNIQIIYGVVATFLQIINVVSFQKTYPLFFVIQLINIFAFIIVKHKFENKVILRKEKINNLIVICSVIGYSVVNIKNSLFGYANGFVGNTSNYIIVFITAVFLIEYIKGRIDSFMDKTEIVSLERLAYIDSLTGIANRNMCEKKFDEIDNTSVGMFEIIMFDVKGLKYVNDNFGHKSGDELIVVFAKALKNTFGEIGAFVGRMGGDEFVVIVNEEDIDKIDATFVNLDKYLSFINNNNKYMFNIAYHHGISLCDRTRNNSVWKKFSSADNNMYEKERL